MWCVCSVAVLSVLAWSLFEKRCVRANRRQSECELPEEQWPAVRLVWAPPLYYTPLWRRSTAIFPDKPRKGLPHEISAVRRPVKTANRVIGQSFCTCLYKYSQWHGVFREIFREVPKVFWDLIPTRWEDETTPYIYPGTRVQSSILKKIHLTRTFLNHDVSTYLCYHRIALILTFPLHRYR